MLYYSSGKGLTMQKKKAAFAYWDNRIAPVFDTARNILVVDTESGRIVRETRDFLPENFPVPKVLRLLDLGVQVLVCGAVSRPMHELVSAYGIQVVPFVAGGLREVVDAWLNGRLMRDTFSMPGCRRRGRHGFRGRRMRPGEMLERLESGFQSPKERR